MVLEGSADFRNVVIANNSPTYQLLRLMPFRDQTARFTFEQCVLAHDGPLFSHGCFNYDCAIQIDNSTLVANDIGENEYVLGRSVTTVDARNSIFIWDDPDRLFSAPVLSRFDWCLFDNTGAASAQPAVSGSDNLYGSASLLPGTFRLTSDSPAIDAGAPDPAELLADLAGRLRVFDGDGDGAARVDIGAYEFAAPSFGDVNCDNAVNYFDIDPFVIALLDADTYAAQFPACDALTADMNQDGVVNYFDLDPFVTRLTRR
jgi:hypothetical protein